MLSRFNIMCSIRLNFASHYVPPPLLPSQKDSRKTMTVEQRGLVVNADASVVKLCYWTNNCRSTNHFGIKITTLGCRLEDIKNMKYSDMVWVAANAVAVLSRTYQDSIEA